MESAYERFSRVWWRFEAIAAVPATVLFLGILFFDFPNAWLPWLAGTVLAFGVFRTICLDLLWKRLDDRR